MIWLSWRQHRAESAALSSLVALLCGAAVVLGMTMSASFDHLGLAACGTRSGAGGAQFVNQFLGPSVIYGPLVLMAVPLLLGMFVGAPLVARELERGTHRLAWAQSVSRRRWFWVKVGFVLAVSCAAVGVLTAALAWSTDGYLQFSKHNGGFDRIGPACSTPLASCRPCTPRSLWRSALPWGRCSGGPCWR
jgi:ABC-type transport system involved in multi-copper enzyme maturation permease subunit